MRKTSCWMLPAVLLALAGCSPTASTGSDVPAQAEQDPLAAAVDKANTDYARLRAQDPDAVAREITAIEYPAWRELIEQGKKVPGTTGFTKKRLNYRAA